MTKEIKERLQRKAEFDISDAVDKLKPELAKIVESEKEAIARQVFYEVKKLFKHYHTEPISGFFKITKLFLIFP